LSGPANPRLRQVIQFEAARARDYFTRGVEVASYLPGPGRAVVKALIGVYRSLLDKIERRPDAVFERRVSVSWLTKARAILVALPHRYW
jgi:15-cis-phytoene synthase